MSYRIPDRDFTKEEVFEMIHILAGMVEQNCGYPRHSGNYFSGFIGAHADAIEFLCDIGVMKSEHGRSGRYIDAVFVEN